MINLLKEEGKLFQSSEGSINFFMLMVVLGMCYLFCVWRVRQLVEQRYRWCGTMDPWGWSAIWFAEIIIHEPVYRWSPTDEMCHSTLVELLHYKTLQGRRWGFLFHSTINILSHVFYNCCHEINFKKKVNNHILKIFAFLPFLLTDRSSSVNNRLASCVLSWCAECWQLMGNSVNGECTHSDAR